VGHIVVTWSLVEQQMDCWVNIACNQCAESASSPDQKVPMFFDEKKEFLRACFSRIAFLQAFQVEGSALLQRAAIIPMPE